MADKAGNKINLKVVTPYQNFYEGDISSIIIPTTDGDIGFMPGHVPMVVALKPGVATVRVDEDIKHFTVSEGFAEVSSGSIIVVCNSAEYPEDIKLTRMCRSYKDASEAMENAKKIVDPDARKLAIKEVEQEFWRFKARRHIIEMYGDADKKDRLVKRLEEFGIK
ncbi:MAG: ATP synthase F1 subunit epsilon [Saccharofermentans sp.]|nr:ATP synthase F1 subunit epsilon [Saccharofermentans sp.]